MNHFALRVWSCRIGIALVSFAASSMSLAAPAHWAPSIDAFTQADAAKPPPSGSVVGSSSIARWKTLGQDFASIPTLNRGFGGSQLADSVYYADRIIIPYAPEIVVAYARENDLAAGTPPETGLGDYGQLCEEIHAALPQTRIVFIALQPSPAR